MTIADSNDWDLDTDGSFTVDFWVNLDSSSSGIDEYFVSQWIGGGGYTHTWDIWKGVSDTVYFTNSASYILSSVTIDFDTWVHVAVVDNNSTVKMYFNGIEVASGSSLSINNDNLPLTIGAREAGTGGHQYYLNGYMDELRITKGEALWSSNFTPPTSESTATANTKLLLRMD